MAAKRKFDREQVLAFLQLIEDITLADSPEEALEKLMRNAADVLDVEQGCILLLDPENNKLLRIECAFEQKARPKGYCVELDAQKHPNLYKAIYQEPIFVRQGEKHEDVNQVLYIRLETENLLGVMVLGAKGEKKEFNPDDILVAQAISNLAISSIRHDRLLQKKEHLKTLLSERMRLADKIRNPLTVAGGFVLRISKKLKDEVNPQTTKDLKSYSRIALKEFRRVEKLLTELLKTK